MRDDSRPGSRRIGMIGYGDNSTARRISEQTHDGHNNGCMELIYTATGTYHAHACITIVFYSELRCIIFGQ